MLLSTSKTASCLLLFRPNVFVNLNEMVGERGWQRQSGLLESSLSSWIFYETEREQLASVFRSLVKNHPFVDGNKRTAVLWLLTMAELCELPVVNDDALFDCVVEVAAGKFDVSQIAERLFATDVASASLNPTVE